MYIFISRGHSKNPRIICFTFNIVLSIRLVSFLASANERVFFLPTSYFFSSIIALSKPGMAVNTNIGVIMSLLNESIAP